MAVKFIDNSANILRRMDSNCMSAMEHIAEAYVESVQYQMLYGYHTPHGKDGHTEILESGALFDSIQAVPHKVSQNTYGVRVGSDKDYAGHVHDGTYKLEGRPFMKDGVLNASDTVKGIVAEALPNGIV